MFLYFLPDAKHINQSNQCETLSVIEMETDHTDAEKCCSISFFVSKYIQQLGSYSTARNFVACYSENDGCAHDSIQTACTY